MRLTRIRRLDIEELPIECPHNPKGIPPLKISLNPVSSNHNEVRIGRAQLVFSYKTLVAYCDASGKRYQSAEKFSAITSKHIAASGYKEAQKIDQHILETLVAIDF